MAELLALAFYIAIVVFCIWLFFNLIWISLLVGAVGGLGVGLFYGFKNYFSSLIEEIKLRK